MTQFPGKLADEEVFPGTPFEEEEFPGALFEEERFPGRPFEAPVNGKGRPTFAELFGKVAPVPGGQVAVEFTFGVGRGLLQLGKLPFEQHANIASALRFTAEKITGRKFPLLPQERLARSVREFLDKPSAPGGFLEPSNTEIFNPSSALWWAGRGGEGFVFLMSALLPGVAVGQAARGFALVKNAKKFAIAAATLTSAALEGGLAKTDFVRLLEERGLTPEEAEILGSLGAGVYGTVAGFLDLFSMSVLLGKFNRPAILGALKAMGIEGLTEGTQRVAEIATGVVIGAEEKGLQETFADPDTLKSILAEASLGFVISGGVAIPKAFTAAEGVEGKVKVTIPGKVKEALDTAIDEKATVEAREKAITVVQGFVEQQDRAERAVGEETEALAALEAESAAQKVRDLTLTDLKGELATAEERLVLLETEAEVTDKEDEFAPKIEEQKATVKELESQVASFVEETLVGEATFVEGGPVWLDKGLASVWQPGENDEQVAAFSFDRFPEAGDIVELIKDRVEELQALTLTNPNLQLPKAHVEMSAEELEVEVREAAPLSAVLPEGLVTKQTIVGALEQVGGKKVDLTDRTTAGFDELMKIPWGELKSIARDTGIQPADYLEENREDLAGSIILMRDQKARRITHEQTEGSAEAIVEKLKKAEMEIRESLEEEERVGDSPLGFSNQNDPDMVRVINAFPDRALMLDEVRILLFNNDILDPFRDDPQAIDDTIIEATSLLIPWVEAIREKATAEEAGQIAEFEKRNRPEVKAARFADAVGEITNEVNDQGETETEFPPLTEFDQNLLDIADSAERFRRVSSYHDYLDRRWQTLVENGAMLEDDRRLLRVLLQKSGTDIIKNLSIHLDPSADAFAYFQTASSLDHPAKIIFGVGAAFKTVTKGGLVQPPGRMAWTFMHELGHAGYFEYMTNRERARVVDLFGTLKLIKSPQGSRLNNRAEEVLAAAGIPAGVGMLKGMEGPHEFFAELFAAHTIRKQSSIPLLKRIFNKIVERIQRLVESSTDIFDRFPEARFLELQFDKLLAGEGLTRRLTTDEEFRFSLGKVFADPIEDNLEDEEAKSLERRVTEDLEGGPMRDPREAPFPEEFFFILPGTKQKKKPGQPVFIKGTTAGRGVVPPKGKRRIPEKVTEPIEPLTGLQKSLFRIQAALAPEPTTEGGPLRAAPTRGASDIVKAETDYLSTVIRDNPLVKLVRGELKVAIPGDTMRVHEMPTQRQQNYARTLAQIALAEVSGFPERFTNGLGRLAYALRRMDQVEAAIVEQSEDISAADRRQYDVLLLEQFPQFRERIREVLGELGVEEVAVRKMHLPVPAEINEIAVDDTHPQVVEAELYQRAAKERFEEELTTRLTAQQELEVAERRKRVRGRAAPREGQVIRGGFDALVTVSLLPFKAANLFIEREARLLVDLVETHGGPGESGKIIADVMRASIDQNKIFLGRLQKMQVNIQKTINLNAAAAWRLQRVRQKNGRTWDVAPLAELIATANTKKGGGLGKGERAIIISLRRATRATAKILQEVGLIQKTKGGLRLFERAIAGRVFLRMATTQMHDILVRGGGLYDYQVMVSAFAEANHVSREVVDGVFKSIRDQLTGEMRGSFRMIGPEIQRRLPIAPTHIWVRNRGMVELFVSSPREYLDRLIRDTAARASVVKIIGQSDVRSKAMRKAYGDGQGDLALFDATMRALSNLPPFPVRTPAVEGVVYRSARVIDAALGILRATQLTAAVIPNIPEMFGTIGPVLGYGNMVQALGAMTDPVLREQAMVELIRTRMFTKDIVDFSLRRAHAVESILRKTGDFINRASGIKLINEGQEQLYGFATLIWMNAMFDHAKAAGKPAQVDIWRLRLFGNTKAEAIRLASGEGTTAEYETVGRQAVRFFISSAVLRAETSHLRNLRWYNFAFWYTTFFSDTVRIIDKHVRVAWESIAVEKDAKQAYQGVKQIARLIGGKETAGVSAAIVWSLALGGLFGVKLKRKEAEDDVWHFLWEGLVYAVAGGIYGAVLQTVLRLREGEKGENVLARLARVSGPASILIDSYDWTMGTGPYKDMTFGESLVRFGEIHVTASRTIPGRLAMTVLGKAYGDPKVDFTIKQYWRWRFRAKNKVVPARTEGGTITAEHREFRRHMRLAAEAQRKNLDPSIHLSRALGVDGKDSIAVNASLKGKLLLADLDEEQQARLRKHLGTEGFNIIFYQDALVKEMMITGRLRRATRATRRTRRTR